MITQIGKYKVEGELAIGGFGRIYRGRDEAVGRLVALKVLSAAADESTLARFSQEAAAAGGLHHPNIVTIYEFGLHEGDPFLAMEFLEGRNLEQAIAAVPPLSMLEKLRILRQLAEGVAHAHQHGIVHRDIKPSNIMILPDGAVKIMDFGIARISRQSGMRLTQVGDLIGTLLYMSPEQFRNFESDALSDIFAVGIVAYELISGTHPFFAEDTAALMYRVTNEEPQPVCDRVPDCPPALDAIVRRALSKDRHLRYQSLQDFLYDLEPLVRKLETREAERLLGQAQLAHSAADLQATEKLVGAVLALDPANASARLLRAEIQARELQSKIASALASGKTHLAAKRWAEAVTDFGLAARLDNNSQEASILLATANEEMERFKRVAKLVAEARRLLASGDAVQAAAKAEQACGLDSEGEGAQQLLDEARSEISRRQSGAAFRGMLTRARGYLLIGELERAETLLESFGVEVQQDPAVLKIKDRLHELRKQRDRRKETEFTLNAARGAIRENRLEEALSLLESLPTGPEASFAEQRHLLTSVRQHLNEVRAQSHRDVLLKRVESLLAKEEFEEAWETLEAALVRDPEDPQWQALTNTATEAHLAAQSRLAAAAELEACNLLAKQGQVLEAAGRAEVAKQQWPEAHQFSELLDRLRSECQKVREDAEIERVLEAARVQIAKSNLQVAAVIVKAVLAKSPDNETAKALLIKTREIDAKDVPAQEGATEIAEGAKVAPAAPNLLERATSIFRGFFR